ncbi:MAG: Hsp70 family protein [Deltaproteobacteria bacterium]|nr:Hsp70 family protein [Deltaproteobacteria bacterium]
MSAPRYAIGIDLGTTHSALSRIALDGDAPRSERVDIDQLVTSAELERQPLLASFLYLPPEAERPLPLPWDGERPFAVGGYARARAPETPGRVVASAKSWLCHPTADRRSGLLPLEATEGVDRISPVEASWRYLEHLAEAYDARFAGEGPRLAECPVVLTVPASFDASARELTVEAALAAGIENLTLLEEPQAALYAWLEQAGDGFRSQLQPGDVVLVVDVGGGTSDFSAIAVTGEGGELGLERIAVGDHILLGGDNMDLALAHFVKQRLAAEGTELDAWQMASLTHGARVAKERLFGDPALAAAPIVIPRRGAKLVGGAIRTELGKDDLRAVILDGFFPEVGPEARPAVRARTALTRFGLPYASDAAITRHLAAFLGRQAGALGGGGKLLHPTCVLFNGGVMKSELLRERIRATLERWLEADGAPPARVLHGADLDLAVARGAACFGRVREGHGIRIRGGTAQAHYVGVEGAAPAVPGIEPPLTLVCVAPFGMQEGSSVAIDAELAVVVGERVSFRFFGSSVRRHDEAGASFERYASDEVAELPAIEVELPAEGRAEGEVVPVRLCATVTDIGTLLVEAVPLAPRKPDERWKVELSVREP